MGTSEITDFEDLRCYLLSLILGRFFFNGPFLCTFLNVPLNTKEAGLKKPNSHQPRA